MLHLIIAVMRTRYSGLLRLRKANIPTRLVCHGGDCGLCCKVMGPVTVLENERTHLPINATIKIGDVYCLKDTKGKCDQLKDNYCSCYNVRPLSCREYPWYNINGILYYDSGCPGINHDVDERHLVHNISLIDDYLPTSKIIRRFLIHLFKVW